MQDAVAVEMVVENRAVVKAWNSGSIDNRAPIPGWLVVGLFIMGTGGEAVCVDYRVRAIPNTRDIPAWLPVVNRLADSMLGEHADLPAPVASAGGVPRYVFEAASQTQLLRMVNERLRVSERERSHLAPEALAILASSRRKPGRPPIRSIAEKLEILRAVEGAYASHASLDDVAERFHMSRSGLRDLLSWARHDAQPPMFTSHGPGARGGRLTPEALAILDDLGGASGKHR